MNMISSSKFLKIGGSVAVIVVTASLVKYYLRRTQNKKRKSYPNDVVILHQFPRHKNVPNMSPFCLKLETWLRMSNTRYENEFSITQRSPKGKLPFITLNGVDVSDSFFCIEYLTKTLGKDLSDHLNLVEKSIARAFFKLTEESLHWCMGYFRFIKGEAKNMGIPTIFFYFLRRSVKKMLKAQGYGRHTAEEVLKIAKDDLKALEDFISNKKYLFGDHPCVEDAVVFAWTCQFLYVDTGPLNKHFTTNCPNLMRHLKTIKDLYWVDWENCLKK